MPVLFQGQRLNISVLPSNCRRLQPTLMGFFFFNSWICTVKSHYFLIEKEELKRKEWFMNLWTQTFGLLADRLEFAHLSPLHLSVLLSSNQVNKHFVRFQCNSNVYMFKKINLDFEVTLTGFEKASRVSPENSSCCTSDCWGGTERLCLVLPK